MESRETKQSNREIATRIAKFRTKEGGYWQGLADDIEAALDSKDRAAHRHGIEGD